MPEKIYIGDNPLHSEEKPIRGEFIQIDGKDFYKISNYDHMRPFFMTIVSDSDHWMFISSTGGLTAGRRNENSALFPYYTDDKISASYDSCGPKSIFRIRKSGKLLLWEPFTNRYKGVYDLSRNIYKNALGNTLIFEEVNHDLGLRFSYSWQYSDQYGFVRKSELQNLSGGEFDIEILDGIQNILPYGLESELQNSRSNLVNAYKKNELDSATGLGMILLSAIIVDKAEPSEALKATTVWSSGIEIENYLLSSRQLEGFREGGAIQNEESIRAEPGAYFINSKSKIAAGEKLNWQIVAEVNQGSAAVHSLQNTLINEKAELLNQLDTDIQFGEERLKKLVACADGLQKSNDLVNDSRHRTNVLFNIMRGGIFDEGYSLDKSDFDAYMKSVNRKLYPGFKSFIKALPDNLLHQDLMQRAFENGNPDLIRISLDYLPLTFSRRHGDPSRPWNKFSIETKKEDGSKNLSYQGNWRDIFQNWEALAYSYPEFINSMISKFLNASTMDGYNPYRITREGVDWEVIEPDDPWSYIGYWGDHQIIYLLKLLEVSLKHSKEEFHKFLNQPLFVYANVPYRIKDYESICKNPKDTIDFDQECEKEAEEHYAKIGSDGKLVYDSNNELIKATLTEKLLVTLLTKLSNFIPEGGIWLNTQRPEWNDANNALVGNGISMVTLYYMHRFAHFAIQLFEDEKATFHVHSPVKAFFRSISNCFESNKEILSRSYTDKERKKIMDELGKAGEDYRNKAYAFFEGSESESISAEEITAFLKNVELFIDHSIRANKREDGLYHSYNLLRVEENSAEVSFLYEMLEGQVAVLSSGYLSASEAADLMSALRISNLYREDQNSYILYPNRDLPAFLEKNNIPKDFVEKSDLAKRLLDNNDVTVLRKDSKGGYHFNGSFTNANGLKKAMSNLDPELYGDLPEKEEKAYLHVFEEMFRHKEFTGRSGTFFGYEGLGSIYWHMVSKLLLAVQENIGKAKEQGDDKSLSSLVEYYWEVREGIGAHKSPEVYGAFPIDPYSHTPGHKGAQQPGMTGQVKEDVINRWAELGVVVNDGKLSFNSSLLHKNEFLKEDSEFNYFNVDGKKQSLSLSAGELAFTYCQVPIVYKLSEENSISIETNDGQTSAVKGAVIDKALSNEIFSRTGKVRLLRVAIML